MLTTPAQYEKKTLGKHGVSDHLALPATSGIQVGFSRFEAVYERPSRRGINEDNQNGRTGETSVRNPTQRRANSVRWEANKRAARFIAKPQTRRADTSPKKTAWRRSFVPF